MVRGAHIPVPGASRISLLAVAWFLTGCGAGSPSAAQSAAQSAAASGGAGTTVTAGLSEFKIDLGATSAPAGAVTFALSNDGTTVHEFVVFQTDLAADKLPLSSDGTEVDEEGAGLTAIDEVEDVAVGAKPNLAVTLPAGHYVVMCNLPAHYTSGMRAEFTTQ